MSGQHFGYGNRSPVIGQTYAVFAASPLSESFDEVEANTTRSDANIASAQNRVVLDQCKAVPTGDGHFFMSFDYRFESGQPKSDRKDQVHTQFIGSPIYDVKQVAGAELKREGTLDWKTQWLISNDMIKTAKSIEMTFSEVTREDGDRSFSVGISEPTAGDIQSKQGCQIKKYVWYTLKVILAFAPVGGLVI